MEKKIKELEVKCLDLHNQILHRPDTYIGGTKKVKYNDPVWVVKNERFVLDKPTYSEGLLRIFVEIVSNAIDNVWRSEESGMKCKSIKININRESGETSVWNDGRYISLDLHKEQQKYIPELIFSRLLTSTNYNDEENRKTSGKNGYGGKLTNIFSTKFWIKLLNPEDGKVYEQEWRDNMKTSSSPKIKNSALKNGYTLVSWIPDFSRFDNSSYDDDIISLYTKYIYDTAMIVSKYGVKVYFNDKLVPISSLSDYALMYNGGECDEVQTFSSVDSRVVVFPFSRHISVSFVNGMCTTDGGVHDDAWTEAIFRPIVEKINGKKKEKVGEKKKKEEKKNHEVSIDDVYKHFAIFIECEVSNPEFRGQNKTKLTAPKVQIVVKPSDIQKIMKWSVIDDIKLLLEARDLSELKIKKRGFTKVEGLDDANFAKKPTKRTECVLCISEGLSAKTYIVQGMKQGIVNKNGEKVAGRDYIGVLPIRGKFINPKGRSMKTVAANKEVKSLIQALGVQIGIDYTEEENFKTLRYGRLSVFADSDCDGQHIIGLLYNFISTLYPSLLKVDGFFSFARTPIIKLQYKGESLAFYYLDMARKFITDNNISKKNIKYYKGLGTSVEKDVSEDFGQRIVILEHDEHTDETIDNIFSKKRSGFRKEWITTYDPTSNIKLEGEDGVLEKLSLPDFINTEFINFSIEDCKRSIPSIFDGLKESQRKILYSVFKKNLKYSSKSLKVAQLAGYVAEQTNYHHGEDNLLETIRGMAQRYVGSNNMPYLFNDGQFGSRLENGADGASGRYIFTKGEEYLRELFIEEDDYYLKNLEDDGDVIEKEYYLPIIPTILINGATGIGTGFSTSIPCYNPNDIINWIKEWISSDGEIFEDLGDGMYLSDGPELNPWYRGFKGDIIVEGDKVTTYGKIESIGKNKYRVSEIPIGKKNLSISKFKSKLEELLEKKVIKDFEDHSDDNNINFIIAEDKDGMSVNLQNLGLVDCVHTSNMVLFSKNGKLKRYKRVEEIIDEFCKERLQLYKIRREGELSILEEKLDILKNKIRFINEVNSDEDDKLTIRNVEEEDLYREMEKRGYKKKQKIKRGFYEEKDEEENEENEGNFNYLLDMKMRGATKTKMLILESEKNSLEKQIEKLKSLKDKDIWLEELNVLEKKYTKWLKNN